MTQILSGDTTDVQVAGFVTALRAMDNDVPVCVLSARSSVDDRVAGLEAGADDYLVKPFVLAELVARVKALLRRRGATATFSSEKIQMGPLEVDIPGRRARVNGVDVDLTKREFDLLAVLAEHKTAVLSRAQLLGTLSAFGFVRQDVVREPGEFAVRGSLVVFIVLKAVV